MRRPGGSVVGPVIMRFGLYTALVVTPGVVVAWVNRGESDPLATELGCQLALTAFAVVAMQFIVSARFRWVERPLGLDMVFRFHKAMAVVAAVMLLAHPLALAIGDGSAKLLVSLHQPWYIYVGKAGLVFLLLNGVVSLFRAGLRLSFERWRTVHNVFGAVVLLGGFVHSMAVAGPAGDLRTWGLRIMWAALFAVALVGYLHHRVRQRRRARAHAYTVAEVIPETHNVTTLKLMPAAGGLVPEYLPGQFHFLTLHRGAGFPVEEHPFTIASSPTEEGCLRSTIKASGDFTSTIRDTRPGDRAAVEGPFGRFSHVLEDDENLVFLAGGIGITPLMSMLRYLRDTGSDRPVLLLYANRTEQDTVFRQELEEMEAAGHPCLRVVHVLSEPGPGWSGETGRIDREKIERFCSPDLPGKAYYVCGPPPMAAGLLRTLRALGVADTHLRHEQFQL